MTWANHQGVSDALVERLFEDIDGLFALRRFDAVDDFLRNADVNDTDEAILLGILKATFPQKRELLERRGFFARAREEIRRLRSESIANALLKGLE